MLPGTTLPSTNPNSSSLESTLPSLFNIFSAFPIKPKPELINLISFGLKSKLFCTLLFCIFFFIASSCFL
jgi:hypothetical protein